MAGKKTFKAKRPLTLADVMLQKSGASNPLTSFCIGKDNRNFRVTFLVPAGMAEKELAEKYIALVKEIRIRTKDMIGPALVDAYIKDAVDEHLRRAGK